VKEDDKCPSRCGRALVVPIAVGRLSSSVKCVAPRGHPRVCHQPVRFCLVQSPSHRKHLSCRVCLKPCSASATTVKAEPVSKKLFMPLVTKYISAGGSSLFCGENHTLVSLFLVADNDTDLSTLFEAHRSACAPTREQQHDFEKRVADMLSKPVKALANQEPLIWACRNDRSRCVRELLKAKANVEGSSDANKMSPLHHAANNNKLDCVEMLVKYGANTVALDSEGKTPKFYAQQNTNVRAYLLAVERGCEREKLLSAIFACTRQQPYTFIWPIIEFCVEYVYGEIEIR